MSAGWLAWVGDALVAGGVLLITLAVLGVARMPDAYMKLHAAAKATSVGVTAIAAATVVDGDAAVFIPALLAAVFLLVTATVSAHAIARAAIMRGEEMHGPDAVDESEGALDRLREDAGR